MRTVLAVGVSVTPPDLLVAGEVVASGMVLWCVITASCLFVLSRRVIPSGDDFQADAGLRFFVVIPALNEGRVIAATLEHLLAFPVETVLVVDDGSDDDTGAQVLGNDDPRVQLLQRRLPDARKGKGEALNAAYRWILARERNSDPDSIVICVADGDGRLSSNAVAAARGAFTDRRVGACQTSVRIRNRTTNYWTRMQHFEFVAYTALYQRARQHTRAVGLGGNGQFVRLSALRSLGDAPWSDCLTEDMDLGIRLLLAGWSSRYLETSWVSQQAVPDPRRLFRQRTRWFQGALQCARHLPVVAASDRLPLVTRVDLAGVLIAPVFLLVVSPFVLIGWVEFGLSLSAGQFHGAAHLVAVYSAFYLLAFLPALLLSVVFWLDEPDSSLLTTLVTAHLFLAYGYLWTIVGWRAAGRQLVRQRGWVKTARIQELSAATSAEGRSA